MSLVTKPLNLNPAENLGVRKAVHKLGGQIKMAQLLGVSQQAISKWQTRGFVPAERVGEISEMTGVPARMLAAPKIRALL
jgi:DNA-binding transcriptional regulator YdaS (Cro superfamily)